LPIVQLVFFFKFIYIDFYFLKEGPMKDMLFLLGIFAAWYIINRWVLPKMGVQT
jgi:hypothetical protein